MAQSLEARLDHREAAVARPSSLAGARRWGAAEVAVAFRWGTIACTLVAVLTSPPTGAGQESRALWVLASLVVYAGVRTRWPLCEGAATLALLRSLALEAAVSSLAAAVTGAWSSPLLIMVGAAFVVAGFLAGARGLAVAVVTASLCVAAVALGHPFGVPDDRSVLALQRIPELIGFGAVGAYAHRLVGAGNDVRNRLGWMNEVHSLLLGLNRLAAEHPGLFTVDGAVQATVGRVRDLYAPDTLVVLLRHPTAVGVEQPWEIAFSAGALVGSTIADSCLPRALRQAVDHHGAVLRVEIAPGEGIGCASASALYAPVVARGQVCGVIALEMNRQVAFTEDDRDALGEVARNAGIAIDSARSFLRLRNLGAQEERERIGRELHDQVGQSLAAVAFRIDRIHAALGLEPSVDLADELEAVAGEIRAVNGEIRETLAELRGGPTSEVPLADVLQQLLVRVETRSALRVRFVNEATSRLPDVLEREMWRIACEAVRNAERHSGATCLTIALFDEGPWRVMDVSDDGRGIDGASWRPDAYGLLGMRERADLIDATLELDSAAAGGTVVRLRVPRR